MFKYTLSLYKDSNFSSELNKFYISVQSAEINTYDSKFLIEQVEAAILQYKQYILLNTVKSFSMNRQFEGNGYKVNLKFNNKNRGLFEKILNSFWG